MKTEYILNIIYDPQPEYFHDKLRFYVDGVRIFNNAAYLWFEIGRLKNDSNFIPQDEYGTVVYKCTLTYQVKRDESGEVEIITSYPADYNNLHFLCASVVFEYINYVEKT